jgi:hypothetical protein
MKHLNFKTLLMTLSLLAAGASALADEPEKKTKNFSADDLQLLNVVAPTCLPELMIAMRGASTIKTASVEISDSEEVYTFETFYRTPISVLTVTRSKMALGNQAAAWIVDCKVRPVR